MPVEVTVSSVTLGDDCGEGLEEEQDSARSSGLEEQTECVQTAMQLAIKAGAQASSLRVKQV